MILKEVVKIYERRINDNKEDASKTNNITVMKEKFEKQVYLIITFN